MPQHKHPAKKPAMKGPMPPSHAHMTPAQHEKAMTPKPSDMEKMRRQEHEGPKTKHKAAPKKRGR